jgi:exosortase H (IPTLxxWG-CTERM-specific)
MKRFFALFAVIVVALFALELSRPVQQAAIIPFTEGLAHASAFVIRLFDANVIATGKVLQSTSNGFAVSIEAGCNGVEAAIVLAAAMLAFRAPLAHKLAGLAGGVFTVQALNLLRIISLFYLGQWSMRAFEWAHLYLWQALIMLDVLIVWLLWLRWLPRDPRDDSGPPAEGSAHAA